MTPIKVHVSKTVKWQIARCKTTCKKLECKIFAGKILHATFIASCKTALNEIKNASLTSDFTDEQPDLQVNFLCYFNTIGARRGSFLRQTAFNTLNKLLILKALYFRKGFFFTVGFSLILAYNFDCFY